MFSNRYVKLSSCAHLANVPSLVFEPHSRQAVIHESRMHRHVSDPNIRATFTGVRICVGCTDVWSLAVAARPNAPDSLAVW